MTAPARIEQVSRAIRATLEGDSSVVADVFTPDVHATLSTTSWSAAGLAVEIEDRAGTFEDVDLHLVRVRGVDDEVWVEWTASVFHVGPLLVEDTVIPPSGRRNELHGMTVAEFVGDRIAGFRQYWDGATLMDPDAGSRPRRGRLQRG